MTATVTIGSAIATPTQARGLDRALAGTRPLLRKEFAEWRHGRRAWVTLIVVTVFMTLTAANGAITAWIIANVPDGADAPSVPTSLAPLDNLMAAVGSQIFVLAAIFAAMSLLVVERERGTLAWVASKPVARPAIWVAKFVAGATVVSLAAGLVPLAITVALVIVLYGAPALLPVTAMAVGVAAMITLFVAIVLATSAYVANQAAVAAIGFAAFALPSIVTAVVPLDIGPYLPTSILPWAVGLATGMPVGVATPIAWLASVAALAVVAGRRMESTEL